MSDELIVTEDVRRDLQEKGDGFNINIDGVFSIYVSKTNGVYSVETWVGDDLLDKDIIDIIMLEDEEDGK